MLLPGNGAAMIQQFLPARWITTGKINMVGQENEPFATILESGADQYQRLLIHVLAGRGDTFCQNLERIVVAQRRTGYAHGPIPVAV